MDISNQIAKSLAAYQSLASDALQFVSDRFEDLADFISPDNAPPTQNIAPDFIPPFTGGQCPKNYKLSVSWIRSDGIKVFSVFGGQNGGGVASPPNDATIRAFGANTAGAISGIDSIIRISPNSNIWSVKISSTIVNFNIGNSFSNFAIEKVLTADSSEDTCGDLPNPNTPFPSDNGIVISPNPDIGKPIELLAPALPIASISALLAKLSAAANALKSIGDAIEGLRKIGDALDALGRILKSQNDREKDREKKESDKRQCSVGQWVNLNEIDGFLSTAPIQINGKEGIAYAVEINAQNFPSTASRILGSKSPSICPLSRPLFYLMWQDVVYAVSGIREVQILHSIHYVPEFCQGFFWNHRENPQLKLKARIYYQTDPEEEEEATE